MNQFFIELYKLEKNSWDEFFRVFRNTKLYTMITNLLT